MTTDNRDHHIRSIPFAAGRLRWHASMFSTIVHEMPGAVACVTACLPRNSTKTDARYLTFQKQIRRRKKKKTLASHGCSPRAYLDAPPYSLGIWSLSILESNVWYTLAAVQDVICQNKRGGGSVKTRTARSTQYSSRATTGATCARRTGVNI